MTDEMKENEDVSEDQKEGTDLPTTGDDQTAAGDDATAAASDGGDSTDGSAGVAMGSDS